tara:strand:- start:5974 stop:6903 length:930 start_codon:yes stop_codon:yes gene_type:complete
MEPLNIGISTDLAIGHAAALGRDLKEKLGEPLGSFVKSDLNEFLRKKLALKVKTDADRKAWGYLISLVGNKGVWSATQCRFLVFETMGWLAKLAGLPDYFSEFSILPNPKAHMELPAYGGQSLAENGYTGRSGPDLQLGLPRTISIKNRVRYPNITVVRNTGRIDQYMPKSLVMRYSEDPTQPPELETLPFFRAVPVGFENEWVVEPSLRNLPGREAKFSMCMLAEQVQCFLVEAIALQIGETATSTEATMTDLFDLFNLVYRKRFAFYLTDPYRQIGKRTQRVTVYGPESPSTIVPIQKQRSFQFSLL